MDVRDLSTHTTAAPRLGLDEGIRARNSDADASAQAAGSRATTDDTSRLSAAAYAVSGVMQMPELRADRVASLQAQIADGSYQVSPGDVADALLRDVSG